MTAVAKARPVRKRKSAAATTNTYAHVIEPSVILWLFVSLILVAWDTGYIFMRPLSMPGGSAHSPVWSPYALYGTVDYIYGWPAWNDGVGFTAAQGFMNIIESSMYLYYLYKVFQHGEGTGWYSVWDTKRWSQKAVVEGDGMATAVLICLTGAVMTVSKTVLYFLNEYFSSWMNVGHNNWSRLIVLWIIPNGAWLVVPTWVIYLLSREVVSAMQLAGRSAPEKDD